MSTSRAVTMILFLAACGGPASSIDPADPLRPALLSSSGQAALDASAAAARHYSGRCSTAGTIDGVEFGAMGPTSMTLTIHGECQLTHLGRTSTEAHQTVTFTGPDTQTIHNTTTNVSADGDELYETFDGPGTPIVESAIPIGVEFSGTEVFAGGTGRFTGASGSSILHGKAFFDLSSIDPKTGFPTRFTGWYATEGTISY